MLDNDNDNTDPTSNTSNDAAAPGAPAAPAVKAPRKRAAKKAPTAPAKAASTNEADAKPAKKKPAKKVAKKITAPDTEAAAASTAAEPGGAEPAVPKKPAKKSPRKAKSSPAHIDSGPTDSAGAAPLGPPTVLFVAPDPALATPSRSRRGASAPAGPPTSAEPAPSSVDLTAVEDAEDRTADPDDVREAAVEEATGARRRRRRGRRGRGGAAKGVATDEETEADEPVDGAAAASDVADDLDAEDGDAEGADGTHRRRRRRRTTGEAEPSTDDPPNTVVHVRPPRAKKEDDGVRGVKGSTRLEAKRQRRRDGRDTSRRRPPILTEAEFLARREAVERVMAVRQTGDRTQIAVLEDDVLVEHYVTRASATSYVGNVYLGRVQNVLPSMEAAFVDIGKGRNGVLYAGEVNWDVAGLEGKSRAIEDALKSGDTVLVQVTKDPIGHKGGRLTSQVSLPGRFLVYVPGGGMTGISRKLPDTERHRLKAILKKIVPEDAGVIVRTAAEGASEEELTRDVERLQAQWQQITKKAAKTSAAPTLVHGEPDLAIRVVRDVFNEDFARLIVQGEQAWETVSDYVTGVAPDLGERVSKHTAETDLFHDLRVDEQIMKALDRKVWLPSGGSLVIDRTEAMTVIDVNTGKFVGTGGNLEQTVTRNNLEAAEEIVRQLRLRDVGGIVVIDFIDMVLESNRDLVLRRLTECLGRDRTKHQVAEVTSLGLVQMTRKRVGEGLLEAFSDPCEVCRGRGVIIHSEPVDIPHEHDVDDEDRPKSRRKRGGTPKKTVPPTAEELEAAEEQRRAALQAMSAIHRAAHPDDLDSGESAADKSWVSEHLAAQATEPVATEPVATEPVVEAPQQTEPEPDEAREPERDQPATATVRTGQRRRRAASRPAGPPAAVTSA